MKSLFALGAWSIAALCMTGAAFGQYSSPSVPANNYWATSEGGAVGSGVAPSVPAPQQQYISGHAYAPPVQSAPTYATPTYTTPTNPAHRPAYSPPTYGQVNYQRDAPGSRLPAPSDPRVTPGPTVAPEMSVGPAQIGVSPAQNNFTLNAGTYCEQPGYGVGKTGWFGGGGAIFFDRDNMNPVWLSVDDANISDRVLTTRDAEMNLSGGFEASLGRYFKNSCYSWQISYWGLFPTDQYAFAYSGIDTVGNLGSSRSFDGIDYNGGAVATAFNTADAHMLRRDYSIHNLEWNIFGNPCVVGCGKGGCKTGCGSCKSGVAASPWRWNWLAGFRYLRFDEGMTYATDPADTAFDGAVDEIYYDIDVENHLFGFQVGGIADYCMATRWSWRNAAKVGIYGSHMKNYQRIGGSAGAAVVNNVNSPYDGQDFLIRTEKDDISMMAEWDTGLSYQWTCNWRARFGYRVIGVTGVAFAPAQIPTATFTDLLDVGLIDSNGSLILHGGYASLEYSY